MPVFPWSQKDRVKGFLQNNTGGSMQRRPRGGMDGVESIISEDTTPDYEPEDQGGAGGVGAKAPRGLFGTLGDLFKTKYEAPEIGDVPLKEKPGLGKTLLEVGLPTLFGAASGVGILPGLMSGIAGQQGRIQEKYDSDVAATKAAQDAELNREWKQSTIDLGRDKLGVDKKYKDLKAEIDKQNADSNRIKANNPKLSDFDRYKSIGERIRSNDSTLTEEDLDFWQFQKDKLATE